MPPGLDDLDAVLSYEGTARAVIAGLKYRNARGGLAQLGAAMAARVAAQPVDLVTWVPTSAARVRARGFDQAALLAREVASRLRAPSRRLLVRGAGAPQTGRSLAERRDAPVVSALTAVDGLQIVLVDDVVTTGSTLAACAAALRAVGAAGVHGIAAAATPRTLGVPPAPRSGPWRSP